MYPVSEAFLQAVQKNTRKYYWAGKITTKAGQVHEFGYEDIVKGSGYISCQCCGNTEIELGTVYASEMGITLFSQIDRYTLEDAKIEMFYNLRIADGSYEQIPMGIYEVSEANRLAKCLELKAYDYMLRFERNFNGFETVGTAYDFLALCCKSCQVEMAQTQEEISAMLNADVVLSIYPENDIETYRDVLYFTVIQALLVSSACPPENVKTSPKSNAGFPMVSESNGTYSTADKSCRMFSHSCFLVSSRPNCRSGFTPRFIVSPSSVQFF